MGLHSRRLCNMSASIDSGQTVQRFNFWLQTNLVTRYGTKRASGKYYLLRKSEKCRGIKCEITTIRQPVLDPFFDQLLHEVIRP